jgi:hypothetical protein
MARDIVILFWKRILSTLLFTVVFLLPLSAQVQKKWHWVKQIGGDSWDISAGMVCDSKNNLYVIGSFFNTLKSDTKKIESLGNQDLFIAKFDQSGIIEGLYHAGGRGSDMATCLCIIPGDELIVGGTISDAAAFGKLKISDSGKQLFTAKLDSKGAFVWVSTLRVDKDASLYLSGVDNNGKIFVGGTFTGTLSNGDKEVTSNGRKDVFLARLNQNGSIEELFSFGGEGDDIPRSMAIESSGNILMAGTYNKSFELGDRKFIIGPAGIKTNAFITKFDSNFKPLWINTLAGEDYCDISSLKLDYNGNFFVTGSYSSKIHLSDTILSSNGYSDIMFLKYSTDGDLKWIKSFGSSYYDYSSNLNIDKLGGAIITGTLGDVLNIDSLRIEPIFRNNSAFLIQFSSEGQATWGDCISGNGRSFSTGSILDNKGNLYFTGSFRNEFRKDNEILTSMGDQDVFLAKYYNCDNNKVEILGELSFCQDKSTEISIKRNYSTVVWNDTIKDKYKITVDKPGISWVAAIDNRGCNVYDTVNVKQNADPVFSLGQDTTLSVSDSIILKAPDMLSVDKWQDFSTEREYIARSLDGNTGEAIYWLTARDSLDCYYTDTISINYVQDMLSDLDRASIAVHPNPTRNRTWWSMNTEQVHNFTLEIINEQGVKVLHQQVKNYLPDEKKEINMESLPSGVYYIRISFSSASVGRKSVRILKN